MNSSDTHTFTILSGNGEGIFMVDAAGTVRVADAATLAATATTDFLLTVQTTDSGTPALSATATVSLTIVDATSIATTTLRREMFTAIGGGTAVSDLTSNAKYPGRPDALDTLPNGDFETPEDVDNNYGSRIRAYVVPPVDGDYQFFIASDDSSQLKFSMDTNPANATVIASVSGWTGFENGPSTPLRPRRCRSAWSRANAITSKRSTKRAAAATMSRWPGWRPAAASPTLFPRRTSNRWTSISPRR